jgi:hypothetical protein
VKVFGLDPKKRFQDMAQSPNTPNGAISVQVFVRFCLRIVVLCVFATLGSVGFGRSLAALLWFSTILCTLAAIVRRELPLGSTLTHWDEGAAYGALYCLTLTINQASGT